MKGFDRKFGPEFIAALPPSPGVYRVFDEAGALIYVGKAKNLRRRLSQYRNAKRIKAHRKMREIVSRAARIETENCATELDACLLEARLIQEHRPRWNVAGAFYFLYPLIGMRWEGGAVEFVYTTLPDSLSGYELHGAFRSREIAGEAFFSLMKLLRYVGHESPRPRERPKRTYVFRFRQLPPEWARQWARFFRGESRDALEALLLALVENAAARRKAGEVQDQLDTLKRFFKHEARRLRIVRERAGHTGYPVTQRERDLLFLAARHGPPRSSTKNLVDIY